MAGIPIPVPGREGIARVGEGSLPRSLAAEEPQVVGRRGLLSCAEKCPSPAKANNDCLVQTIPLFGKCAHPFCLGATAGCCRLSLGLPPISLCEPRCGGSRQ